MKCSIDGCASDARVRGWCRLHYARWWRNGDPLIADKPRLYERMEWLRRVALVDTDDCLLWPFRPSSTGYGRVQLDGHEVTAAHVILDLVGRARPVGSEHVKHSCGNNLCCNHRHIYIYTKDVCSILGCQKMVRTRGWCEMHYARWMRTGTLDARHRTPDGEKLAWLYAVAEYATDECIPWPFPPYDSYGYVNVEGVRTAAHHVLLELTGRERPAPGLHTRHLCGNPFCCNPGHLLVGTPADNVEDMRRHGRMKVGSQNALAKLDENAVLQIRIAYKSGVSQPVLAEQYGMHRETIGLIVRGKIWKHVQMP